MRLAALLAIVVTLATQASAEGTGYFVTRDLAKGASLAVRAGPRAEARLVGRVPADATCIRNLGCIEGSPRWCRIEFHGMTGWARGANLAEGACRSDARHTILSGVVKGDAYIDHPVRVAAGQALSVSLKRQHPQNSFNVQPSGSDAALYLGQAGEPFSRVMPDDGDYVVRVYLQRAAARRGASSRYTLTIRLTGEALHPRPGALEALVPGTRFHSTGKIACVPASGELPLLCDAGVVRRMPEGAATVEVSAGRGVRRRILFMDGTPVSSDATRAIIHWRVGEVTVVNIAEERYEIPDALLNGG